MSSLIFRPALLLPQSLSASSSASSSSTSSVLLSWRSNQCNLLSLTLSKKSRRFNFKAQCFDSSENKNDSNSKNNPNGADSKPPNGTLVLLLKILSFHFFNELSKDI